VTGVQTCALPIFLTPEALRQKAVSDAGGAASSELRPQAQNFLRPSAENQVTSRRKRVLEE
jgi:hypothetical protein